MIGEINKHVYYKPNMLTLYNSAFLIILFVEYL